MTDGGIASTPLIPASWGEVIDKLTILEIKRERISGAAALANIGRERDALEAVVVSQLAVTDAIAALRGALRALNARLWDIEDAIRECEHRQDFGADFIALARSIYKLNDERAGLKRAINLATASGLVEEKSYR